MLTITISCLAGPCLKYVSCLYLTLPLTDPASCTHGLFVTLPHTLTPPPLPLAHFAPHPHAASS